MCSSLVDWPIYPRLANTMRALNDAQNTGRMRYATSPPRHAPGNIRLPRTPHRRPSNIPPAMLRLSRPTSWPPPNSREKQTNHYAGETRHAPNFGLCREVPPAPSMCLGRIGGNGRRRRVEIEGYAPSAPCDDKCAKIPLSSIRTGARRDKEWHGPAPAFSGQKPVNTRHHENDALRPSASGGPQGPACFRPAPAPGCLTARMAGISSHLARAGKRDRPA